MNKKNTETVTLKHFPGNGKPETVKTIEMTAFKENKRRQDYTTGFEFPHPSQGLHFEKG